VVIRASACNSEGVLQIVLSVGLEAFAQSIGEAAYALNEKEEATKASDKKIFIALRSDHFWSGQTKP
jgi:hypothetical protein